MASRYLNLPQIELTTLDGQLIALGGQSPTESVLIIAPALDGPVDRPVRVNSIQAIEHLYGPVVFNTQYTGPNGETSGYSGNALIRAMREVQAGGATDIRLLRVGGYSASGTLTGTFALSGVTVNLTARYPGSLYNDVTVAVASGAAGATVSVTQPTVKGGSFTVELADDTTLQTFVDSVNTHPSNRSVVVSIASGATSTVIDLLNGSTTLAGGLDGTTHDMLSTNKTQYYSWLMDADYGAFTLLDDYEVDNLYVAGLAADDMVVSGDATKSIAVQLADYLGSRSADHPTLGFVGVRPLLDGTTKPKVTAHFNALTSTSSGWRDTAQTWTKAGYFMHRGFNYSSGNLEQDVDAGAYLQVVAGDAIFNDRDLGLYVGNVAGVYAGTVAALKPHMPATHKPVNGIFGLPYEFSKAQLDTLVGGMGRNLDAGESGKAAYVTVRRIEGRGILWTRDVTASSRTSDFKDLQPLRIANAVHKAVKEICFPFLGQPNDIPHRQALETALKTFLEGMYDAGALLGRDGSGYLLSVRGGQTPLDNLLGVVSIDITLRPALQMKAIKVRVKLSL
jgi:hypothetical protein